MANNTTSSIAARNAMLAAGTALLNVGGAGTLSYYTGSQPATPDTAIGAQVLLATDTFSSTSFAAPSSGVATANAITTGTAVAAGTVAWARLFNNAGTAVYDCTVGTSGCDITVGTTTIVVGNTIPITSFTLSHP